MNNTSRIILILLLAFSSTQMAGCSTAQDTTAVKPEETKSQQVSQRRQLESSALLVDGVRQKALGNWSQAALLFFEAIERDPMNDAALFELGKIHAMEGEFEDALGFAEKAVEIDPDNSYYHLLLADVFILTGRLSDAIGVYEFLAQNEPDNVDFHYNLANAYIHNNQYHSALSILDHIEEMAGFVEEISLQKQKILIELGEYEQAIVEAEKLLEVFPEEPLFYELLGELYSEIGQQEMAIKIYQQLLEIEPGNPVAFLLIADYHQSQGDTLKAFEYIKNAFGSPDLDVEGKGQILYSFYLLSEEDENYLDQAITLSEILVEVHPGEADAHLIYGDLLTRKGNMEQARDRFLTGAQLDPSNMTVWQQILYLDGMLEDFEAMKEHSEMALEYFFEQPLLFLYNGLAHMSMKNYEDAAAAFEYGLTVTVSDPELEEQFYSFLGDVYHYLDDHPKSDYYYEQTLELNPDNPTALNNYSYHLAERQIRLEEAEAMSKRALELDQNAAYFDTYGWILYQLGNYEEARYWIKKSIETDDYQSAVVLEHYGDVLYKLGETQKALEYWNKAIEAGEGSPLLEKKVLNQTLYE